MIESKTSKQNELSSALKINNPRKFLNVGVKSPVLRSSSH